MRKLLRLTGAAALAWALLATGGVLAQDTADPGAADLAPAGTSAAQGALSASGHGTRDLGARGAIVPVRTFPHRLPDAPEAILWDNGPIVTHPGGGGGGADASRLQNTSLGMNTLGFTASDAGAFRLADDFTVTDPAGWDVSTVTVFCYQTGSTTTSTFDVGRLQIWSGDPSAGGTVVFGDTTTNRMIATAWTNAYRDSETTVGATNRPVMSVTMDVGGFHLDPGSYWIDFQTGGTSASGPFCPPITITGEDSTGNAMQWTGTAWAAANDSGSGTPQGIPFVVDGTGLAGADVTLTKTVSDVLGVCGTTDDITVTNLTPVEYCFTIENTGTVALNYHTLVDDHLGTILDNFAYTLLPGGGVEILVPDVATQTVTNTATIMSYVAQLTMDGLTVDLNNFSHTWPDDVDILLVGPGGENLVLQSDVGGSTDMVGVNVNLDDAAGGLLPDGGPIVTGSYRPTNVGLSSTEFPAPAPPQPWGQPAPAGTDTLTSIFGGANPNGEWSLFVVDDTGGDSGSMGEWCLTIQPSGTTVCNSTGITIPSSGAANPYPSTIDLSGPPDASSSDTATVTVLNPVVGADPVSLSSDVPPGGAEVQFLDILNGGDGTLNWTLYEQSGEFSLEREIPLAPVPLVIDDGTRENAIGLTAGGQFIWLNRFTPAPTDFPFQLNEIHVLFPAGSGINVGELVDLYVYEDTDGDNDPGTGANFLGSMTGATVQAVDDVTFSIYALPAPVQLNGPGDVLIAVVNRTAGTAAGTFVAAIDTTASQVRSWVGIYTAGNPADPPTLPADGFWGTIDSAGFPGNWLVRGLGEQGGGTATCSAPEDLPWLGLSQGSGSTAPMGSTSVAATFFSAGLPIGVYNGLICIDSNDPVTPVLGVPVTLAVTLMPFIDGFESGDTTAWSSTVP